jgi:hypothetical protein
MTTVSKYLQIWLEYQRVSKELNAMKPKIISQLVAEQKSVAVKGYTLSVSSRPVFSKVTLETARKFDAVHKVVNSTKLNEILKQGNQIEGVEYTNYINVRPA